MIRRRTAWPVVVAVVGSLLPATVSSASPPPTGSALASPAAAAAGDDVEVLITYSGVGAASARTSMRTHSGVDIRRSLRNVDAVVATVAASELDDLRDQPGVQSVALNLPVRAANESSAAGALIPEAVAAFGVNGDRDGNATVYTSADAVAAVLDTGLDATHPGLDGGKVLAWYDAVDATGFDTTCTKQSSSVHDDDPTGHGTHVAGTIAGTGEGNSAGKGMAPAAALVGVKVLDCNGLGDTSTIVDGLAWVMANRFTYGIEVVNLSIEGDIGCNSGTDAASLAVNQAFAAGLLVVVAAGNFGADGACSVSFPGTAADALTVGAATDPLTGGWSVAGFSGRGPTADGRVKPDLVAGGDDVLSARNGGGYQTISGTSMSTPVVAGVALLLHDLVPTLNAAQMKSTITSTANNFGGQAVPNNNYGYGAVDAFAALNQANNNPPPIPVVREFSYGKPDDVVIIGDWNGDGIDTPGVRRFKEYFLNNSNAGGNADVVLGYGKPDDEVFVGDWTGDGIDTLAIRRKNIFYVRFSITSGPADVVFGYGKATDEVLVGDWNGDGIDNFAVRRGKTIFTRDDFISGPATNTFSYGKATDTLIVGDWNGNGFDTFGVHRLNVFFLKNTNTSGPADFSATFGQADDIPLAGDWDGNGVDDIGVRDGRVHRLSS